MAFKRALFLACGAAALSAHAASAQTTLAPDRIVVTANPFHRPGDEVTSNVAVLGGDELAHRREGTLGETLDSIPGVNSDTFGGGSSRPVVRGQTAPRVKSLSDGAALLDASEVSPDHAVATEPLLLDRIEILRGPSALLYGGGAIGGAVNLIDRKIATELPQNGGDAALETRLGSADDEEAVVAGLTMNLLPGERQTGLVLRAEAATRKTDDYEVPDFETERVPGSFNTMTTGAVGLSLVGRTGYFGLAYSAQDGAYGLPGHSHEYESCHPHGSSLHCGGHDHDEDDHDHDHGHDDDEDEHGHGAGDRAEAPVVDLASQRIDIRGQITEPFAGIDAIRLRAGLSDYRHDEIDEGEIGTTFTNEGYDGRIEVQHAPFGGLRGVVGIQHARSDFAALGDESFVPETRTDSTAVFLFEEYTIGDVRLEGAVRQEWQDTQGWRLLGGLIPSAVPDASHSPLSVSGAAIWSFRPGWSAAVSLSRSQRAPTVQELYARGVHLATNTYEIGDVTLDEETANAAELTLRKTEGATTFSASVYHYDYDGYIFARTLDQFEEFRLIQYSQADASFTGLEGEVRHDFGLVALTAFGDYVRGKLSDGGGDLPRIPAARLGARADVARGSWFAELEYYRVFEQDKVAAFETVTPGYDMVNATISYQLEIGRASAEVFVRGTNLLDELALNHVSFLKTSAPLRGRNFVLGLRASF